VYESAAALPLACKHVMHIRAYVTLNGSPVACLLQKAPLFTTISACAFISFSSTSHTKSHVQTYCLVKTNGELCMQFAANIVATIKTTKASHKVLLFSYPASFAAALRCSAQQPCALLLP
jgi:hypothetical protein